MSRFTQRGDDDLERGSEDSQVFEDVPLNPVEGSRSPQNEDPDIMREEDSESPEDLEVREILQSRPSPRTTTTYYFSNSDTLDLPEIPAANQIVLDPSSTRPVHEFPVIHPPTIRRRRIIRLPYGSLRKLRRGLTSDRIKRFSTFNADQKSVDDGCAICIDGVEINKLMIRLECDHFYCSECISKWFEKNTGCPLCRKEYYN